MSNPDSQGENLIKLYQIELKEPIQAHNVPNNVLTGSPKDSLPVFVTQNLIAELILSTKSYKETIGILTGQFCESNEKKWLHISGYISGECIKSSRTSVHLTCDDWQNIDKRLLRDFPSERIVGWYHSHPGFGAFLSTDDLFVHRHFFDLEWYVALVIDPFQNQLKIFQWQNGIIVEGTFFDAD